MKQNATRRGGAVTMALLGVSAGIATLATVVSVAEWALTRARNEAYLRRYVETLDRVRPGWRLRDLNATRTANLPPPERNAATQALKGLALAPPSVTALAKEDDERFAGRAAVYRLLAPADLHKVAALRADSAEALAILRPLRAMPKGGLPLRVNEQNPYQTPLDDIQQLRVAANLLAIDAVGHAHENEPAEALASCEAMVNVASGGVGSSPTLMSQLVRISLTQSAVNSVERTLGLTDDPAGLARIQARLHAERTARRLSHAYRGERAMAFHTWERIDRGELTMSAVFGDTEPSGVRSGVQILDAGKAYPKAQSFAMGYYSKLLNASQLPDPKRGLQTMDIALRLPRLRPQMNLSAGVPYLFLVNVYQAEQAEAALRARIGCAVAGIACERFRQRAGRWPKTLREIPKDILSQIPRDPGTGWPLEYRINRGGVVIYSHQAGVHPLRSSSQMTEHGRGGTVVGFRVFNPQFRRAAPPKPPDAEPPPG